MPERLSLATVGACIVLVGAGFGGAYALAHDAPAKPPGAPAPPTTIQLKDAPIGELHRVRALPALVVPPPPPAPTPVVTTPQTVVTTPTPQVSAPAPVATPAPTPAPAPTPKPQAPARKPQTFDDSG